MPEPDRRRGARSRKFWVLAAIALTGALALVASTQAWVVLTLVPGAAATSTLVVTGHDLNASLSPVAVAVLASALALTIAGPVFRRLLAVVVALLGAGVAAIAVGVLGAPVAASASALAELTGILGDAQSTLVRSSAVSVWPAVTVGLGALLVALGIWVLIVAGRWQRSGRRYESSSRAASPQADGEPDRIADWELLSDGEDPSIGRADPGSQETSSNR